MSERLEDRLRRAAQTYRRLGNHSAEGMFLEAADTITELRGALQVASVDYRHLSEENAKLREAIATAIKVQAVLCGDADSLYCCKKCPLHRQESDDCLACDVIGVAQELGIEVD